MTDKPDLDAIEARLAFAKRETYSHDREHGTYKFHYSQDVDALTAALRAAWEENERLQDEKTELWRRWQDQKAM